jgi:hypothetical protein
VLVWLMIGILLVPCEHINEVLNFLKVGDFTDFLSTFLLLIGAQLRGASKVQRNCLGTIESGVRMLKKNM